jgi:cytochrome c biogenesis protein CcmG, thiol:disulfide interchange protein DsbE
MVALAALTSACQTTPTLSGSSTPASPAPLLPASVTELPSFDVETFAALMAQLRRTPVVVNVWSSWCGPCRAEAADLAAAARQHRGQIQFLGVDILDERDAAVAFVEEFHVPYPSVFDADGEIRDALGFIGQPDTVFYRADGQIASVWTGPLTSEALREGLDAIGSTD